MISFQKYETEEKIYSQVPGKDQSEQFDKWVA